MTQTQEINSRTSKTGMTIPSIILMRLSRMTLNSYVIHGGPGSGPRPGQGEKVHEVGIHKSYFPKEIHPKDLVQEFQEIHKVSATSRTEAAQKIWEQHKERWQSLMSPHTGSLPRKVSLHVSWPGKGTGSHLGRHQPITVNSYVVPERRTQNKRITRNSYRQKVKLIKGTRIENAPAIKRISPAKLDPTRTISLRRNFAAQVTKMFSRLKVRIRKLILDEDALGLKPSTHKVFINAFCPTGPGGGIDSSCGSGNGRSVTEKEVGEKWSSYSIGGIMKEISAGDTPKVGDIDNGGDVITKEYLKEATELASKLQELASTSKIKGGDVWRGIALPKGTNIRGMFKHNDIQTFKGFQAVSTDRSIAEKYADPQFIGEDEGEKVLMRIGRNGGVQGWDNPHGELPGKESVLPSGSKFRVVGYKKEGDFHIVSLYDKDPVKRIHNTRWKFASSPQKLAAFQAWLKAQLASVIVGKNEEELWDRYIEAGFKKGAGRAFDDTKKPYAKGYASDESTSDFYKGSKEQFLRDSFGQPVARETVELLSSRSFDELENVTTDMSNKMSRVLTDGLVQGKGPREIARDLSNETDLGKDRALLVARTEIIRAHAEGQLVALQQLGVEEVGVQVEWSTTGDGKVCPDCEDMEGTVLPIDEAKGLIPLHPRCRCAWIPANVGEDKDDKEDNMAFLKDSLKGDEDEGESEDTTQNYNAPFLSKEDWPNPCPSDALETFSTALNSFCATGPGGGIDPTCGKEGSGKEESTVSVDSHTPTGIPRPSKITVVKSLGGTTGAQLVKDADDKQWVMKSTSSTDNGRLHNEEEANNVYRALGIDAPKSGTIDKDDKTYLFREYLEGKNLGEWEKTATSEEKESMYKEIQKGFVADALLANWDVIGLTKDNILIHDGKPVRMDNGGALLYRAQGAPKGSKFGSTVGELDTMRQGYINPSAVKVFGSISKDEIAKQVSDILKSDKVDSILSNIHSSAKPIMEKRIESLAPKAAELLAPKTDHGTIQDHGLHDGKSLAEYLHKNSGGLNQLQKEKIAFLNPNGIQNNSMYMYNNVSSVPHVMANIKAKFEAIKSALPPGTIVKVKAVSKKTMTGKEAGGSTYTITAGKKSGEGGKLETTVAGSVSLSKSKFNSTEGLAWSQSLTPSELSSIFNWKGSPSHIRKSIASGSYEKGTSYEDVHARNFLSAIAKAKDFSGTLYRGLQSYYGSDYTKQQMEHVEKAGVGGIWSSNAPIGMSSNPRVGTTFSNGNLLIRAQVKTAKPIAHGDGYLSESECIGQANVQYKITGIHKNVNVVYGTGSKKVKMLVDMEEI